MKMQMPEPVLDLGLKVHDTFKVEHDYFGHTWKFKVRSQSEANIMKSCLTYYRSMWDKKYFPEVTKDDVVVDVGAHVGFFAIPIASQVREVIAYEPSPANFKLLTQNIKLNMVAGVVSSRLCAVGASVGEAILNLGIYGTTGHSISNKKKGGMTFPVRVVNLEYVVATHKPTVLKLDCEGAEWDILTDPDQLRDIRIIVAELHKVSQHSLPKMLKTLKQAGMKVITQPNSWFTKLIAFKK